MSKQEAYGPQLAFSEETHKVKYRGRDETFKEAMNRVASTLTDGEEHYHEFRDILLDMRFMPAGRVQTAIGSSKNVTPYNCYVSGSIEDSFVDGHKSIMNIAKEAAATMRMGGGIGYDFSTLRPSGDLIKKLDSASSGPVSFMQIFDSICQCVSSSGHRRGAQMGVMRIDHPDIENFIRAKQPPKEAEVIFENLSEHQPGSVEWTKWYAVLQKLYKLTGFNVSVAITDDFMECLRDDRPFKLQWGGKTYREVDPHNLWELIMRSTWDWAEPGALFIDQINRMNNLWYCERIAATNPCGEQPLPPYGACLLGSFNLVKYVENRTDGSRYFSIERMQEDVPAVVRAMDNVVDVATYPLHEQEQEAKQKRRMGLGVTGLANALEACGMPYGSIEFLRTQDQIFQALNRSCYLASSDLAQEKGSFPLFSSKEYAEGQYVLSLDEDVQDRVRRNGMRNSHLTSIAPTGTISMCADNVSSGIEPVFAYKQRRLVNMPTGQVEVDFDDYGYREFGVEGRRCDEVTIEEHLEVLLCAARRVDSAVSKTCNVPANTPWADFKNLYVQAWERGAKGITTYQVGGKRAGILTSVDEEPAETEEKQSACRIDPATGRRECE